MGEIVNLRNARKARTRREAEQDAARNRVAFGRTKAERQLTERELKMAEEKIDAHKRVEADSDAQDER